MPASPELKEGGVGGGLIEKPYRTVGALSTAWFIPSGVGQVSRTVRSRSTCWISYVRSSRLSKAASAAGLVPSVFYHTPSQTRWPVSQAASGSDTKPDKIGRAHV